MHLYASKMYLQVNKRFFYRRFYVRSKGDAVLGIMAGVYLDLHLKFLVDLYRRGSSVFAFTVLS